MLLHLLRHAEAENASPTGFDKDRRLTEAGLKRMKAIARSVARLEPAYDAILVSPLVRSVETALPVAEACRYSGDLIETTHLSPGADPEKVLVELARLSPTSVLLVGHMPHLGKLFGRLLLGRDGLEVPMKKASLAGFETGDDPTLERAELRFYLPPRVLEKLV